MSDPETPQFSWRKLSARDKQLVLFVVIFVAFSAFSRWTGRQLDQVAAAQDAATHQAKAKKNPWAKDG